MFEHILDLKKKMTIYVFCFPGSSYGKESACNAGDAGSIPGQEDPLEKGDGNALQYSCWEDCTPWCRKRIGHDLVTKQQHQ